MVCHLILVLYMYYFFMYSIKATLSFKMFTKMCFFFSENNFSINNNAPPNSSHGILKYENVLFIDTMMHFSRFLTDFLKLLKN